MNQEKFTGKFLYGSGIVAIIFAYQHYFYFDMQWYFGNVALALLGVLLFVSGAFLESKQGKAP